MKGLFYGVAVSALMLGVGGAALACDQHAKSAALENPAAATQALNARGVVLAQAQQEEQSGTTGEGMQQQEDQSGSTTGEGMQQQHDQSGTTGEDTKPDEEQQK